MRDFFRGWRRKLGVVTLLMACVFAGGWVRSLTITEGLLFPIHNGCFIIVSIERRFGVAIEINRGAAPPMFVEWRTGKFKTVDEYVESRDVLSKHWQYVGFHAAFAKVDSDFLMCAPYWLVVIPLALLSAWLLLSKQPPLNPADPPRDQP